MPTVLVAGPESSGGRLIFRLMNVHPDISAVHYSFPYGPSSGHRYFPTLKTLLSHNPTHLLITARDWEWMLKSKVANHLPDRHLAEVEQQDAFIELFNIAAEIDIPWRTVSYEALVNEPHHVYADLLWFVGVSDMPLPEDVYNGNQG